MKPTHFIKRHLTILILFVCILMMGTGSSVKAGLSISEWQDYFNSELLDLAWSWIGEEPTMWSLTANPGYMRLTTHTEGGQNFLVQPMPGGDFMVETHFFAEPLDNFQNAGILLYLNDDNHLSLIRAYCGYCPTGGNGIYFDHVSEGGFVEPNYAMVFTPNDEAWLRIVKQGTTYTGFVSANGTDWTLVGSHNPSFVPVYVGLRASNNGSGDPITADFDFFKYITYPHHAYLPLLIR
ncbi:MAG: hypothetical protein MUO67_11850 [Anaerolineales bacterium]|nr:hypothetical protein [Anaerolineales bacterium]